MDALVRSVGTIRDVSSFLARFEAPEAIALEPEKPTDEIVVPDPVLLPSPHIDVEKLREEMAAELSAALDMERRRFDAQLSEARAQWAREEGTALRDCFLTALATAFERLRDDIAGVLTPFVSNEMARSALDELIGSVRAALAQQDAPSIAISGPPDVLEQLRSALSRENVVINLVQSEGVEARVDIGSTSVQTLLCAWIARRSAGDELR